MFDCIAARTVIASNVGCEPVKSKIQSNRCSHVVYQIICPGCNASLVKPLDTRPLAYMNSIVSFLPLVSISHNLLATAATYQLTPLTYQVTRLNYQLLRPCKSTAGNSPLLVKRSTAHPNSQSGCKHFIVSSRYEMTC